MYAKLSKMMILLPIYLTKNGFPTESGLVGDFSRIMLLVSTFIANRLSLNAILV